MHVSDRQKPGRVESQAARVGNKGWSNADLCQECQERPLHMHLSEGTHPTAAEGTGEQLPKSQSNKEGCHLLVPIGLKLRILCQQKGYAGVLGVEISQQEIIATVHR